MDLFAPITRSANRLEMRGAVLLMWSSIPDEGKPKTAVSTTDYLLWSGIQPDDNCLWWGNAQSLSLLSESACKESPRSGHCWCRQRPAGYAGPHVVRELSVGLSWSAEQLRLQKHTQVLEVPLPTVPKQLDKKLVQYFHLNSGVRSTKSTKWLLFKSKTL